MNKQQFLNYLKNQLKRYGRNNAQDAVNYYAEIIEDKINDGMNEYQAVASLGFPEEVVRSAASEMVANNKVKNPSAAAHIVLTALSPVILPMAIVIFILYIVIFTVWISLFVSFGASAIGLVASAFYFVIVNPSIGTGLIMAGGCLIAAAVMGLLTALVFRGGERFINLITVRLFKKIRNREVRK